MKGFAQWFARLARMPRKGDPVFASRKNLTSSPVYCRETEPNGGQDLGGILSLSGDRFS